MLSTKLFCQLPLPSGFGTRYFRNGSVYTGQWRAGLFDGRGELRAASPRAAQADADAKFEATRAALIKRAEVRASQAVDAAREAARTAATARRTSERPPRGTVFRAIAV